MPNFSSLAGLEVAEKFLWGVGWGGLHSHFHVKPNRCVVLGLCCVALRCVVLDSVVLCCVVMCCVVLCCVVLCCSSLMC